MDVYALPEEVPAPVFNFVKYDYKEIQKQEDAHAAKLKSFLVSIGYDGPNTGRIFREPHADGYAQYMFVDEGNGNSFLLHLPYGDAWDAPNVAFIPEAVVLQRMDQKDNISKMFANS